MPAFLLLKNCYYDMLREFYSFPHCFLYFWQMLCEERGQFLEIADVIRGLGLTILKGLMETRNDKIWTRFAVEVILFLFVCVCVCWPSDSGVNA